MEEEASGMVCCDRDECVARAGSAADRARDKHRREKQREQGEGGEEKERK